jgi:membrane glycosyltransferase
MKPWTAPIRRYSLFVLALATTATCTAEFYRLLGVNGYTALEYILIGLFTLNLGWIAISFWNAVAGFVVMLINRGRPPGLVWPKDNAPLNASVAVLVPVYNEDPNEVFAHLSAMLRAVDESGQGERFHFYVLSDSNQPESWVSEELAWAAWCDRLNASGRLFYRHRVDNTHKKAGNVAEFCRNWSGAYESMVVLDADSLLSGDTLVMMARLMEANPTAGIIQAPPKLVGRQTLFARLQQFASSVYGPVNSAGLSFWQLSESNYWGHNAIIRSQAFRQHCGLPVLPGKPPFGGEILSHDFVEAALMRRAGFSVWLVPELEGSYEQPPPTLLDYAKRDQRWCQGNLQHMGLVTAEGLHPLSRTHLAFGAMSYLASPIWLLMAVVGLLAALHDRSVTPEYFPSEHTLFPLWPTFDVVAGWRLGAVALGLLMGPKVLGLIYTSVRVKKFRRVVQMFFSFFVDLFLGALLAPLNMLFHTAFVIAALSGKSVHWGSQQRKDRQTSWSEAFQAHAAQTVGGLVMAGVIAAFAPALLVPFSVLLVGLALAIPLSVATSSPQLGVAFGKLGLLTTQEEVEPPKVLSMALEAAEEGTTPIWEGSALELLARDPNAMALHLGMLASTPSPARRSTLESATVGTDNKPMSVLANPKALKALVKP